MEILEHLIFYFTALLSLLQGYAPIHHHPSDGRRWGKSGIYTVKEGYRITSNNKENNRTDIKWNKIWCKDGLPKINSFFWILAHRKTMTTENLKKRGIEGPSCFILCKESEKNLDHIFLYCKFSQEV